MNWDATIRNWDDVSAIATAIGMIFAAAAVVFGAIQLWLQANSAQFSFEDTFTKEYREVIRAIPTKAMLGSGLTGDERCDALKHFYHYFDLCNEQAYIRKKISRSTWRDWEDGIRGNLERKPEFMLAWSYVAQMASDDEFEALRRLCPPAEYSAERSYLA